MRFSNNLLFLLLPKASKKVKAVVAVEAETLSGQKLFLGICINHAEVYPLTEEEEKRKPMVCIHCFPRL